MDWIIPISAKERSGERLSGATLRKAITAFHAHGVVILRGAFERKLIQAMHRDYRSRYGSESNAAMKERSSKPPPNRYLNVGHRRFEITPCIDGALGSPKIFASHLLQEFLTPILTDQMQLNSFSVVVSHPGARVQHVHRDSPDLFPDMQLTAQVPVYAVNVSVPLVDVDFTNGPTGFWPGSHRWLELPEPDFKTINELPLERGDCFLMDYRTVHAGMPNKSSDSRPILYLVYSRPWFIDPFNHRERNPLDLPLENYWALPENIRPMFVRAFAQASRNHEGLASLFIKQVLAKGAGDSAKWPPH